MVTFHCVISNLEKTSIIKDFFSQSFHSCKFFHERVSCVKNELEGNSIKLSMFLTYGLTEVIKL